MLELDYAPPPPDVPLKRFAVGNYLRMVSDGTLAEDAGVELINGWMVEKMPVNPPHKKCLRQFLSVLPTLDLDDLVLDTQGTVAFAESAPEPDLTLSYGPARKYDHRLPGEDDIVLVIEISDTSLDYDRSTKLAMYAAAGIPVYWVVNLIDKQIEVYTKPKGQKYAKRTDYKPGDLVPVTVAGKKRGTIAVADVLP